MAENVGSIVYTTDVDTSNTLQAEKKIDAATDAIANDFKKVDTQVKKTSSVVTKSLSSVGWAAGQAGIQMQQFIGQVQGGVNPMIALSQQGADLGFVLGAPLLGAVVGISASLASMLLPALFNSKKEADKLEKALEALKKMAFETSDGTLVLSNSIEKLSKKSKEAAQIELASGIIKAREALKLATTEIDKSTKAWESWIATNAGDLPNATKQLSILDETMKRTGKTQEDLLKDIDFVTTAIPALGTAVRRLSDDYGITQTQALGLVKVFKQFQDNKTPKSIQAVATAVNAVALSIDKPNDKLIQWAKTVNDAAISAGDASEVIKLFEESLKNMDGALDKNTESSVKNRESVDEMIDALLSESNALDQTARQRTLLSAAERGATADQIDAINKIYDKIDAYKAEQKAIKDRNDEEAIRSREEEGAERFAAGILKKGMSESDRLDADEARLQELREKGLLNKELYEKSLTSIQQQQQDKRDQITAEGEQAMLDNQRMILSASSDLFGSIADVLRQSGDEQSSAYKAMFAISKGFAIALAGLNLASALSQALADPSAVTTAQKFANMAAVAAAGGQLVSAIGSAAFSGGRQYGGPTTPGSNYRINEAGTPEIYTEGGKDYLMNSGGGKVTPMEKFDGGGMGDINVSVINNGAPATASVERIGPRDVKIVLDALTDQVSRGQGQFMKAMKQNTNLQTKAGGR